MSNKLVGNLANIIYEPRGSFNNNTVFINNCELPSKMEIQNHVIKYVYDNPKLKKFFLKTIPLSILSFLYSKLPKEIIKLIYQYVDEPKKHIFHLMYNHWYRQLKELLLTMKGEEYGFNSMLIYEEVDWIQHRSIIKDIDNQEEQLDEFFKHLLKSLR